MSQVFNEQFAGRMGGASLEPRFVVRLSFDNADTDFIYLTSHDDADLPDGVTSVKGCLQPISGVSQKLNPDKANSSIGSLTIKAVDLDGVISATIAAKRAAGFGIRHKKVLAYVGFKDLAWEDYERQRTFIIESSSSKDGLITFKAADIQRQARKTIFNVQQTTLAKGITATQSHIPATASSLSLFPTILHDDNYSAHPNISVGYIKIEDEIIAHTGLYNHPTDGISFQVLQRGSLNTAARAHDSDASKSADRRTAIKEVVYIEGVALKVIYALLTGVLYGQAGDLPSHWHLGIDTSLVRLTDLENAGDDLWNTATNTGKVVRFIGVEKQDGKAFIEKELLLWNAAFMPVYADGALGFKRMTSILSDAAGVVELNNTNVVSYGDIKEDMKAVINTVQIDWNYDHVQEKYTKPIRLIDADSILQHGDGDLKTIQFRGVTTGRHTDEEVREYLNALRDRYAGPPLTTQVNVLPQHSDLEVGDVVRVKLDQVRDPAAGGSLDRAFEIQSISTDWATGNLKLTLFGSSQKATLLPISDNYVMQDAFYTSEGTDLDSVLNIVNGVMQSSNATAIGGYPGIYYYDGDLEIPDGVTLKVYGRIELRIKGDLIQNGIIDGKGSANTTSGIGRSTPATDSIDILRVKAYNESTSWRYWTRDVRRSGGPTRGSGRSLGFLSIVNNDGLTIDGANSPINGVNGATGRTVEKRSSITVSYGGNYQIKSVTSASSSPGTGGAGVTLISRGYSLGPNAKIDTSGAHGQASYLAANGAGFGSEVSLYRSAGGGGSAGGFLYLIDGNSTPPDVLSKRISRNGDTVPPSSTVKFPGTVLTFPANAAVDIRSLYSYSASSVSRYLSPYYTPFHGRTSGYDLAIYGPVPQTMNTPPPNFAPASRAARRVGANVAQSTTHFQYIPAAVSIEEEQSNLVHKLPDPQNLQLFTGTDEVVYASDGTPIAHMRATWDAITDPDLLHYEVQEKRCALSNWQVIATVSDTASPEASFIVQPGEGYEVRLRAVSINQGGHSDFVNSACVTAAGDTEPPPNVALVVVDEPTRTIIDWQAVNVVDLAGYRLRYQDGNNTDWASASPFFDGHITFKPFTASADLDQKTVLVKAVDTSGNESAVAASVFVASLQPVDPVTTFTASYIGDVWSLDDISTLTQDTAGTTPVTTSGDIVSRANGTRLNGTNINLTQADSSRKPIYNGAGVAHAGTSSNVDFLTGVGSSADFADGFTMLLMHEGNENSYSTGQYFSMAAGTSVGDAVNGTYFSRKDEPTDKLIFRFRGGTPVTIDEPVNTGKEIYAIRSVDGDPDTAEFYVNDELKGTATGTAKTSWTTVLASVATAAGTNPDEAAYKLYVINKRLIDNEFFGIMLEWKP